MGGVSTLGDLGFQSQTAPPADPHPLADLGFKPVQNTAPTPHPLTDLGFKPVATAQPAAGVVSVAGAPASGVPQLPAHPAVNMQPSLVGEVAGAAKEAATHPIETLTGADLPSQTEQKQAMLEKSAAEGNKLSQSALDVQKTAQAPTLPFTQTKTFQKILDPKSKNIVSRVLTGGSKAVEALSSPDNIELIAAMPFAPEDATQLLSGVFSAQMAQGAGAESYEAIKAAHRGDYGEAAERGATALINAAMAAASAKHATAEHPAAVAPEAAKPVLHTTDNVEELRQSAERQSDKIGDAAAAATKGIDGAKVEAVRDSKDTDRIEDKAERQDVKPSQIADIAAAKITVPDQAAADKVLEQLHEHMPVDSVNGSLDEPGKNGVRQVQAIVDTKAGEGEPVKKAEVLIQTPEMNEATARTHDDYRKSQELREDGKIDEAEALEAKITAEHEAAAKLSEANQGERGQVVSSGKTEPAASEPKYKFGSTQTNIRRDSEAFHSLIAARDKVADEDLAGKGKDLGEDPHVTVRYGIKGEDTAAIEKFLRSQSPFEAKLGKTTSFPPSEQSDGAAVLKADVEAPALHRLNDEIQQHGDFRESGFDYKPHATIAYVKPEAVDKYIGGDTEGKTFTVRSIAISDRDGRQREIPLQGSPKLQGRTDVTSHEGRATEVLTPTRKMPSTYRLVEAADLLPSHDAHSFAENADYPKGVQERDYKGSKEAQNRVIQQAQNYDPAYTVNTNPDAVNGPPIITPDGTVLGGNSRAMSTQRLYAEGNADKYRETLKRDAATYGLKPELIDGMKEPVLVRQIDRPGSVEDARKIGSELNKSMTGALGVSERAVSAGKSLKPETLRTVADMLQQDDSSLRELLAKRGPELLKMMQADGAITDRERPQFVDQASGGLSEEGKTFFERALMGSVIDDPRLMDAAPKALLGKLERSLGSIASFGSRPDEWNLLPALRQAVAEHAAIAKNGTSVDLHLGQRSMFGPERNPVVDALVRALDDKPTTVRTKFDQYAKDADQNPHGQTKMFGGGEAFEAFNEAFGSKLTDKEYHDGSVQALRTDPTAAAAEPTPKETAKRDAGVPERASAEQTPGRSEGDGRAPKPPERRAAEGAGTAGEARPAEAKVFAPKPLSLNAPKPQFHKGMRVEARDADGAWKAGTVDHFNDGVNGGPRRGRITSDDGYTLNNVRPEDMRPASKEGPVSGVTSGVGEQIKPSHGAIAYDLDKTLAHYDGYKGPTEIGKPIESEVASLKRDLADGKDVWIFSARAEDAEAVPAIKAWTKEHLGRELPVTNVKYPEFARFVDDRAEKPGYMEGKDGKQNDSTIDTKPREPLGAGEVSRGTGAGSGDRGGDGKGPATTPVLADQSRAGGRIEQAGVRDNAEPAPAAQAGGDAGRHPGRGEDAESKANAARKTEWDKQVAEAKIRTLPQNAAAHKSAVVDVAGHKALALDADGALTWHKLFKNVRKINDQNPLGAGANWRGMTLNKAQVNMAMAYLRAMQEDVRVAGSHDGGASAGYERLVQLLKDARNEQGGAVVLRGDYRADTAREEATHQWQMEHGLDKSEAMQEVASRPEFQDIAEQLREMGYRDASPKVVANELMAKALAGDQEFKLTDEQRENLVRSFLTEAVEEKGPAILKNLPETDPQVKAILNEVKRGYDYGGEYDQTPNPDDRDAGRVREAARGGSGAAGKEVREDDGSGAHERSGQRPTAEGGERSVPEGKTAEGELKAPRPPDKQTAKTAGSEEPVFQRPKAPRPPPSMALPGMEDADAERKIVSGEEEGKQLSEQMRTPLKDISRDAGKMERESPLFFGKGDQPLLFQLDKEGNKENPWYLKSAKILDAKMKGPMPGDALVRMLENNGVKADELKWSGLEDLKGKAKVTPEQVAEHLRENALKVKEVTKGGKPLSDADEKHEQELRTEVDKMKEPTAATEARWNELGDALEKLRQKREGGSAPTKYASYQLPGGKNYREMLMTLPHAGPEFDPAKVKIERDRQSTTQGSTTLYYDGKKLQTYGDDPKLQADGSYKQRSDEAWIKQAQKLYENGDEILEKSPANGAFKSSHWDEPNVLAHVRMNDRTTPDGKKLLHLEEIQSDWHQAGRSKGYATGDSAMDRIMGNTIPDAPFKKDWHEMAFRRMVKQAAENGYDGVSWTPGEKQAERYDLSQQIDKLHWSHYEKGIEEPEGYSLVGFKGGKGVFDQYIPATKLEDSIGKDIAAKIRAGEGEIAPNQDGAQNPYRALKGVDLKVGGEGMKGFYDKIIPDYARKFGKQWGAKVNETPLGENKFRAERVPGDGDDGSAWHVVDESGKPTSFRWDNISGRRSAESYAKEKAEVLNGGGDVKVPYLEITPEMRKDVVEQGVPLFQKVKDEENPVARSVSDLVDDLKAMPKADKGTALDRVANWTKDTVGESLDRSGKALGGVPSAFEKAFGWAKATTAALVHDYLHPLGQTDWKTQAGQMQLATAETALRLQDLAKELKNLAPKQLDRVAMTHYMEAAGDAGKLKEWQAGAKARAMTAIGSDRARYLREAQEHYDQALKLSPEQKNLAKRLREHFNDTLDIAKKNGLLEFGYRNYVMHLYEKAEAANILHLIDTSELNPNPSFIKQRFHDTFYSAEGAGLTPKSKDIGYLLTAYDKSMNEAIASRNFMRSLLDAKAPDGKPIAAIKMRGGWLIAKENEAPQVLNQRERPKSLEGYRDFDRPQLRNFLFKPTTEDLEGFDPKLFEDDPENLAFRGDLIIHPKYASRVEDMLTPSWFERGEGGAQKLGSAIVKGSALAKELMTAIAPFHMVQEGVHGMEHKINPFKLDKIDLQDKTQRLLASHGLTLTNYDAEGLFSTKALKGITEFVPGVNKAMDAMQSFSHWQFQDYIPRLKMQMAREAFERNTKKYSGKLSVEQIAELTAKQSNAAFGNLNTTFDSIPRTKTFKTLLRLATFAPDFLESRIRFVGQAFTRYGGEQRAALIRGALAMYAVSRVTNALLNNGDAKWDAEHAFSIVRNGKSYSLRTVQGDILHAVTDPRGFVYNRLNPLTTRPIVEFLSGRDQMGRQKSATSQVKDVVKSTLPFGLQKVIQTPDEDWLNSILTSTGLESKNYRTPTEEAVHKLYIGGIPDSKEDLDKEAESRQTRGIEDKVRSGHMTPAEVWAKVEKKEITPKQAGSAIQRAQKSRLQIEFSHLHLTDAIDVYAKATPLEQAELKPEFARKQAAIADLPEGKREKVAEKMQELLAENQQK